jgi:hypothetical protein
MEIGIMVGLTVILTIAVIGFVCTRLDRNASENDPKR